HESPWTMTLPLVVLGTLAAVGGIINLPYGRWNFLQRWLEPVLGEFEVQLSVGTGTKVTLAVLTLGLSVARIFVGIALWRRGAEQPRLEPEVLQRAWYVDDTYAVVFGQGGEEVADVAAAVDQNVVDSAVNGVGAVVRDTGGIVRRLQTGYVRNYALGIT